MVDQIFIANAPYLEFSGNAANTVVFPLTVTALAIVVMIGDGYCAFVSINLDRQVGIASAVHKDPGPVGRKAAFVGYQHSGNSAIFLDHSAKGGLKQYPGPGGDPPQAIGDGMTLISIKPVKPGQRDIYILAFGVDGAVVGRSEAGVGGVGSIIILLGSKGRHGTDRRGHWPVPHSPG